MDGIYHNEFGDPVQPGVGLPNKHFNYKSITKLGEATIAGQLAPQTALKVFDDLMAAKKGLNLETEFHLIYLCTPMEYYDNPDWEALSGIR